MASSRQKKFETSIHYQKCVIRALESDIRNPAKLAAEMTRCREQAKTLLAKADDIDERMKSLHELHAQAKAKLKSLVIESRSPEIAEYLRLQRKAERLRQEISGE